MAIKLVIFDMDGTLTEELLDFDLICRDLGFPKRVPILETLARLPPAERERAHAILDAHEMSSAARCQLHEGAAETVAELRQRGIIIALLTRNSLRCAREILGRHNLKLDHVSTREDLPHKPHPESILSIVRRFSVTCAETLMVGDYLYDLDAAANAGVRSVLFVHVAKEIPSFAGRATYTIRQLREILDLV